MRYEAGPWGVGGRARGGRVGPRDSAGYTGLHVFLDVLVDGGHTPQSWNVARPVHLYRGLVDVRVS